MWPHRQQPTRLRHPWDSPSKNTGVGRHFLLQYMKVKSESEVAQLCPTLRDPWTAAYQAPLSLRFSRQEYWSGLPLPSPYWCSRFLYFYSNLCQLVFPFCKTGKRGKQRTTQGYSASRCQSWDLNPRLFLSSWQYIQDMDWYTCKPFIYRWYSLLHLSMLETS